MLYIHKYFTVYISHSALIYTLKCKTLQLLFRLKHLDMTVCSDVFTISDLSVNGTIQCIFTHPFYLAIVKLRSICPKKLEFEAENGIFSILLHFSCQGRVGKFKRKLKLNKKK